LAACISAIVLAEKAAPATFQSCNIWNWFRTYIKEEQLGSIIFIVDVVQLAELSVLLI